MKTKNLLKLPKLSTSTVCLLVLIILCLAYFLLYSSNLKEGLSSSWCNSRNVQIKVSLATRQGSDNTTIKWLQGSYNGNQSTGRTDVNKSITPAPGWQTTGWQTMIIPNNCEKEKINEVKIRCDGGTTIKFSKLRVWVKTGNQQRFKELSNGEVEGTYNNVKSGLTIQLPNEVTMGS